MRANTWAGRNKVEVRDVPGTNHYTIVMADPGARAVADALARAGRMAG